MWGEKDLHLCCAPALCIKFLEEASEFGSWCCWLKHAEVFAGAGVETFQRVLLLASEVPIAAEGPNMRLFVLPTK